MKKLTDTQLVILSKAAQRDDHAIELPAKVKAENRDRTARQLIERGLIAEVGAERAMPIWRHDDNSEPRSLVITETGLAAIGLGSAAETEEQIDEIAAGTEEGATPQPPAPVWPKRRGPKMSAVILGLVEKDGGATISELTEKTHWQPHSVRAAVTGLRKFGHLITCTKAEDGQTLYRLVVDQSADSGVAAR